MATNKVVFGNQTLIDLSGDTASAETVLAGETFHDRSGAPVVGTAKEGHDMISNSGYETTMSIHALDDTDDDVASVYAIANWSNCDAKTVLTTVAQDSDGVGDWNDTWETDDDRTGWLWSADFYRILEDENGNTVLDIEIIPVFDVGKSETVNLYAYRVDDDVTYNGVNGGAVAFKLNGAVKNANGVKVGLKLVHQRTKVCDGTIIGG